MEKDLYSLSREELGRLFPIQISAAKADWKDLFEKEKQHLIKLLGEKIILRIEHIGSTAVPGLAAKPTIDILIKIPQAPAIKRKIENIMTTQGYYYMHDQTDHMMFVKGYSPEGFKGQCYHIHMENGDHDELWYRVYFRDYLISHPEVADEYAVLKRELAEKFKYDREAYTEAKTEFIERVTRLALAKSGL